MAVTSIGICNRGNGIHRNVLGLVQRAFIFKNFNLPWVGIVYNGYTTFLEMIHLEYIADGVYIVYFNKNKKIGSFIIQDDGYYGYYPNELSGYWSSYALRLVADELDQINKEWDEQVKKDIGNGK